MNIQNMKLIANRYRDRWSTELTQVSVGVWSNAEPNLICPLVVLTKCWIHFGLAFGQLVVVVSVVVVLFDWISILLFCKSETLTIIAIKYYLPWVEGVDQPSVENLRQTLLYYKLKLGIEWPYLVIVFFSVERWLEVCDCDRVFDEREEHKRYANNHPYVECYHIRDVDFSALMLLSDQCQQRCYYLTRCRAKSLRALVEVCPLSHRLIRQCSDLNFFYQISPGFLQWTTLPPKNNGLTMILSKSKLLDTIANNHSLQILCY